MAAMQEHGGRHRQSSALVKTDERPQHLHSLPVDGVHEDQAARPGLGAVDCDDIVAHDPLSTIARHAATVDLVGDGEVYAGQVLTSTVSGWVDVRPPCACPNSHLGLTPFTSCVGPCEAWSAG